MTKKNNSYSVVSGGQQDAERSLLEYLKPKQEDRFSKLEAFCDLLSRASNGASSCMCGDKKVDLLPGQFVATVSDLARTWQWQRATVRQFLEGLVTLAMSLPSTSQSVCLLTFRMLMTYLTSASCSFPDIRMAICQQKRWPKLSTITLT